MLAFEQLSFQVFCPKQDSDAEAASVSWLGETGHLLGTGSRA